MSTFKEAAESALRLTRMLGDLATVSDTIARCGDLEAAEGEAKLRLNNLNREIADAKEAIALLDVSAVAQRAAAEQAAADIRAAADAYAAQARADAEAQAEAIRLAALAEVDAAKAQATEWHGKVEEAIKQVDSKTAELGAIEARIARAQAKVSELLGASA